MSERSQAEFARLLPLVADPPSDSVAALGHMMRSWLQQCVADANTNVDSGGGCGGYDLWVKIDGREIFIHLKETK